MNKHVGKYFNGRLMGIYLMNELEVDQWNAWFMRSDVAIQYKVFNV